MIGQILIHILLLMQLIIFYLKQKLKALLFPGNTKRGSITVLLTSCLTGLESAV
jgi:hypothetical protein